MSSPFPRYSGQPIELPIAIGGGLAFALMWLMAATSNGTAVAALGKNWRRLHLSGMHYLWLIFMQSFTGRVFVTDADPIYTVLVVIGLAGLGLRVWAYWSVRAGRTSLAT